MVPALAFVVMAQQNVADLERAVQRQPNAANTRALADAYVRTQQYDRAADAFYRASALYAKLGDPNAAKVLQGLGERYETRIELYWEKTVEREDYSQNDTRARLEPALGCYLGAFIDREDRLPGGFLGNGQSHKDPADFAKAAGRPHAVYFTYLSYGRPFPDRWVSVLKSRGAAAHIAWEPRAISAVQDDAYLRGFAQSCARSGVPIFLRFAGEMNGSWTRYGQDPENYKRMFRTVAQVLHRTAPNVAMVWCPNEIPEAPIPRYYPGRDAVDWVGINFYSVLYNDADRARAAEWRNPADALRFVYATYAKSHPVMIGEWAASHFSVVDERRRPDFATDKIGQLYSALPRSYPRVKAVHWLSMNTIEHALPGRQLNNYSLLADQAVAEKYRSMVAGDYYLQRVGEVSPVAYVPLLEGTRLDGKTKLSAVVKTYEPRPSVIWEVDGEPSSPKTEVGPYEVSVDFARLKSPRPTVALIVKDSKGKVAGRKSVSVRIGKP